MFVYLLITRILFFIVLIAILVSPIKYFEIIFSIIAYFLGCESILVIGCVIYGQRFLLKHFDEITITDNSGNEMMKAQSTVLIIVCITRMLHNVIMTTLSNLHDTFRDFLPNLCIEDPSAIFQ